MNQNEKSSAWKIVRKKTTVHIIITAICLALVIGIPILMDSMIIKSETTDIMTVVWIISIIAFIIITKRLIQTIYFMHRSIKTLERTNKLQFVNEIANNNYKENGNVCFSNHLLYDRGTNVMLAYDDIVWVHRKTTTNKLIYALSIVPFFFGKIIMGIGTRAALADKSEVLATWFCTIDGSKYKSYIGTSALSAILKRNEEIMFGPASKAKYEAIVREFKLGKKNN